jgi:hypothetical protein
MLQSVVVKRVPLDEEACLGVLLLLLLLLEEVREVWDELKRVPLDEEMT